MERNPEDDIELFIELMDKFNDDVATHIKDTVIFFTNRLTEIYHDKDEYQISIVLQLFVSNYCVDVLRTLNKSIIHTLGEFGILEDLSREVEKRDSLR